MDIEHCSFKWEMKARRYSGIKVEGGFKTRQAIFLDKYHRLRKSSVIINMKKFQDEIEIKWSKMVLTNRIRSIDRGRSFYMI